MRLFIWVHFILIRAQLDSQNESNPDSASSRPNSFTTETNTAWFNNKFISGWEYLIYIIININSYYYYTNKTRQPGQKTTYNFPIISKIKFQVAES